MVRRGWSRLAGVAAGVAGVAWVGAAAADSGLDSPDSGVVQMGRGSAWLARADDPLAVYFNPAAMAFQPSGVHVGSQLLMASRCYTRLGVNGQPVPPDTGIRAALPGSPPTALAPGSGLPVGHALPRPPDRGRLPRRQQRRRRHRAGDPAHLGRQQLGPESSLHQQVRHHDQRAGAAAVPAGQLERADRLPHRLRGLRPDRQPLVRRRLCLGRRHASTSSPSPRPSRPRRRRARRQPTTPSNDVKAELKAKDLFIPGVVLSGAVDADEEPRRGGLVQVAGRAQGRDRPHAHVALLERRAGRRTPAPARRLPGRLQRHPGQRGRHGQLHDPHGGQARPSLPPPPQGRGQGAGLGHRPGRARCAIR